MRHRPLGGGGLGSSLLTSKVITCMRGKGSRPTKKVQKKFQIIPNSLGKAGEASAEAVETGWRRGYVRAVCRRSSWFRHSATGLQPPLLQLLHADRKLQYASWNPNPSFFVFFAGREAFMEHIAVD